MMFIHRSSMLVVASLIALALFAAPCRGAFTGLWLVNYQCQPASLPGYRVVRVYARFNDPGDRLVWVFGNTDSPLTLSATGGFYQDPLGTNLAPVEAWMGVSPTLAWDTFCTIGLAHNKGWTDQTHTTPMFPSLPVTGHTSMGWYAVPGVGHDQGAPDCAGMVLIAQLTLPPGSFLAGCSGGVVYQPAGATAWVTVNHASPPLAFTTLAGDVNLDLDVDVNDLQLVVATWGGTGQGIADVNDDDVVDINDLLIVISHWGARTGLCP